jgi:rhomboid family GlyGly-CTERM serine protease
VVVVWCSPALTSALEWRRDAPWQLWRWITGHFCHWSLDHLTWDLLVFVVLGAVIEQRSRRTLIVCLATSALAITGAVALWCPELTSYRGLSGLDCALLGCWLAQWLSKARAEVDRRALCFGVLICVGFAIKLGLELVNGTTLFVSDATFVPVPLAHAVGFLVGAALAWSFAEATSMALPGNGRAEQYSKSRLPFFKRWRCKARELPVLMRSKP